MGIHGQIEGVLKHKCTTVTHVTPFFRTFIGYIIFTITIYYINIFL